MRTLSVNDRKQVVVFIEVCPFADPDSSDSNVNSVLRLAGFVPDSFAVSACAHGMREPDAGQLRGRRASPVNPAAGAVRQEVLYVVGRSHTCRRTT